MEEIAKNNPISVKIIDISRKDLADFVANLIAQACLVSGFSITPTASAVLYEEVPKDIQFNFKYLEMAELKQAFYEGVRGYYGDFFGITTVTIHKWLKSYVEAGKHNEYLLRKPVPLGQKALPEITKKTQEEIDTIMRNGVIQWFENYKKDGSLLDAGSAKYDWLFLNNILVPDDEQIENYLSLAREQVRKEIAIKSESVFRNDKMDAHRELQNLSSQKDNYALVQSYAKLNALYDFFEFLIAEKVDIVEFLSKFKKI
ncbi:MAG: hypothetical protein WCI92_13815 [Bacteroidota bacterium]